MSKIRTLITVCLQLLVATTLLLVVHIELGLNRLLRYLVNPLLSPRAITILKRIVMARDAATCPEKMKDDFIKDLLCLLDRTDNDYQLNKDRVVFENTEEGRRIRAEHHDRHLYAILRPTRKENIQRIENVLWSMSPEDLQQMHERM